MKTKTIVTRVTLALAIVGTAWFAGMPSASATARGDVRRSGTQVPAAMSASATYTCTVNILYVPVTGQSETYQKSFQLAPGGTFVDDFSTATREHVFTAGATQQGGEVVFDIDYFSDVSVFDAVDLSTSLSMRSSQRSESQSGRNRFFTSSPSGYTLSYTLDCLKN